MSDTHPLSFKPNYKKMLEVLLWIMGRAIETGLPATQYEIVKTIFVSDVSHLEKYGRPITFDNYFAMEFGPVPSDAFDALKGRVSVLTKLGIDKPLWDTVPASGVSHGGTAKHYINPVRLPNMRYLSKSDTREIEAAFNWVREVGFLEVRDATHEHPAYLEVWRPGSKSSFPMNWDTLVGGEGSRDLVEDLAHASTMPL